MIMLLLHRKTVISFAFLFLCYNSCVSQDNIKNPQDTIIGKWKLVKTVSGRTAKGNITHTYSTVDVVFEFKYNNILTVKCLRQDSDCEPYRNGDYSYQFRANGDSWHEKKVEIGNTSWWYRISETELQLTQGPVDGASYFFERLNLSEIQQVDSITVNGECECTQYKNKIILKVLKDEPAFLQRGCFQEIDSFYIVLVNKPDFIVVPDVFPCGGIPEKFRVDGLPVLVSGNILNWAKGNLCSPSKPNIRIAPCNLFELKTIKAAEKWEK